MKKTLLVFFICTLAACAKNQSQTTADNIAEEAVVESGVGVVSGMSDEQAGESFAMVQSSKTEEMYAAIQNLILPRAEADNTCGRALFASCNAGVREADHVNCQVGASNAVMNGYVRLTYSQASCVLSSTGDTVDRTYNQTITGPRGGVVTVSSDVYSDYLGQTYGGGGRLSKTASGFNAEVLGKHISLTRNGSELYNVSVRTLSPIAITGTLSRSNRLVDGGTLEVNHNSREFTAHLQPHNLQWQSGCCYPVSGSLDVQYSGSRSGSATITFNGCGSAKRVAGAGEQRDFALNYCE